VGKKVEPLWGGGEKGGTSPGTRKSGGMLRSLTGGLETRHKAKDIPGFCR